ncbi:AraC family transcriptional regulator ligand-binding domain-containing protein [Caulobacter sp. KR2-114]|uniref:AraC family transcriptional regulator ligand-binding domain-containing protein n=1 Tax=Caulobacter sp. KR2-114 TaxID=3400912 RepID=UPI003C04B7BA
MILAADHSAARPAAMPLGWIGHTASLAARQGYDVRPDLEAAGAAARLDGTSPLGAAEYLLMCALIINAVDDEMHGVSRGRMNRGTANLMVQAVAATRDLAGAIDTFSRFFVVAGTFCRLSLETSGDEARLAFRADSLDLRAQQVVEEMLATFLHIQMSFYLGFLLPLSRFDTTAPDHPLLGATHPYFLSPVALRNTTAVRFPAAYLARPPKPKVLGNPLLEGEMAWLNYLARARSVAYDASGEDSLSGSLFRCLSEGDADFETASRRLGLASSELRRGLTQEGASFRSIRRAALVRRAAPGLNAGDRADDLAESLGYSDARSFRRALKLATGLSLAELRGQSVDGDGPGPASVLARLAAEKARQA